MELHSTQCNKENFFVKAPIQVIYHILGCLGPRSPVPEKAIDFNTTKIDDHLQQLRKACYDTCNFLDTCSEVRKKILHSKSYNILSKRIEIYKDLQKEKDTVNQIQEIYKQPLQELSGTHPLCIQHYGIARSILLVMIDSRRHSSIIEPSDKSLHEQIEQLFMSHFKTVVDHLIPNSELNRFPIDFAASSESCSVDLVEYMMNIENRHIPSKKNFFITQINGWVEEVKKNTLLLHTERLNKIMQLCEKYNYIL